MGKIRPTMSMAVNREQYLELLKDHHLYKIKELELRVEMLEQLAEQSLRLAENELGLDFVFPHTAEAMEHLLAFGRKALNVNESGEYESAWLLRRQADAVEEAARICMPGPCGPIDDPSPEYQAACESVADVADFAQRLRQQADELEK